MGRGVVGVAVDVAAGVGDGVGEVVEDVAFVGEAVEDADGVEDPEVFGPDAFEEDGDAAGFEFADDLTERVGSGRVEHLDLGEAQDHHPEVVPAP